MPTLLSVVFLLASLPVAFMTFSTTVHTRLQKNIEVYEASRQGSQPFLVPSDNPRINNPSQYRYLGTAVIEGTYRYTEEFVQARQRYPNLLSCVPSAAIDSNNLDISYFYWPLFRNRSELQLCLFYVADVLQSVEKLQEWAISQGFKTEFYTGVSSGVHRDALGTRIYAATRLGWSRRGPIESNIVFQMIRAFIKPINGSLYFDDHIGFSVSYAGNGEVYTVKSIPIGK